MAANPRPRRRAERLPHECDVAASQVVGDREQSLAVCTVADDEHVDVGISLKFLGQVGMEPERERDLLREWHERSRARA